MTIEAKDYLEFLDRHPPDGRFAKVPGSGWVRTSLREGDCPLFARNVTGCVRFWCVSVPRMAEPQQPIIQWDAGTWIERIDAALEGRE